MLSGLFCCLGFSFFSSGCLGGGVFLFWAVGGGAGGGGGGGRAGGLGRGGMLIFLLFGLCAFLLLFGRAGERACFFFFFVFGRGVFTFLLSGQGRVYVLLFGRGTGVHLLTGLPGSALKGTTTKKTKQQKKPFASHTNAPLPPSSPWYGLHFGWGCIGILKSLLVFKFSRTATVCTALVLKTYLCLARMIWKFAFSLLFLSPSYILRYPLNPNPPKL